MVTRQVGPGMFQQLAKEVMYRAHGLTMDEALRIESLSFRSLADSQDLAEGNLSFREKRDAVFKGT